MTTREITAAEPSTLEPNWPTLKPAQHRHSQAQWIMQVPVLSTAHLPMETFDRLEELDQSGYLGTVGGIGALIRIGEPEEIEDETTGDAALDALYAYVSAKGYRYFRLDPDGEVCADLPTFAWD